MAFKVLVTVDLHSADSTKRQKFDDKMNEKKWVKLANVTTTYRATFTEGVTADDAVKTTKADVATAASHAGITNYHAACLASENKVEEFKD